MDMSDNNRERDRGMIKLRENLALNREVTLNAYVTMKVYNEYGDVIQEVNKQAESFTRYWLDLLQLQLGEAGAGSGQIYNVSGVSSAYGASNNNQFNFLALESQDTYGIQIGFSGIAATISDNALASKIRTGQTSGRVYYGAVSVSDVVMDAPSCYTQITRTFLNQGGGNISVNEVNLAAFGNGTAPTITQVLRDAIPTVVLLSGLTGSVTYTIRVTV